MVKVKIYSTSTCPFCKSAKAFFEDNDIEYEEIDIEGNQKAAKEMEEISGQRAVPVIDIDGQIVVGFDEEKLLKLLKIK